MLLVDNLKQHCKCQNETDGETNIRKSVLAGFIGLGLLAGCGMSDEGMAAAKAEQYQADVANAAERCFCPWRA